MDEAQLEALLLSRVQFGRTRDEAFIFGYTIYSYRVFRDKVRPGLYDH